MCKEDDELMLINTSGVAIRINVSDISITNRSAMGVTLMRTTKEEKVVAITKIANTGEAEENINEEESIQEDTEI